MTESSRQDTIHLDFVQVEKQTSIHKVDGRRQMLRRRTQTDGCKKEQMMSWRVQMGALLTAGTPHCLDKVLAEDFSAFFIKKDVRVAVSSAWTSASRCPGGPLLRTTPLRG
jgi:hypothetical protein